MECSVSNSSDSSYYVSDEERILEEWTITKCKICGQRGYWLHNCDYCFKNFCNEDFSEVQRLCIECDYKRALLRYHFWIPMPLIRAYKKDMDRRFPPAADLVRMRLLWERFWGKLGIPLSVWRMIEEMIKDWERRVKYVLTEFVMIEEAGEGRIPTMDQLSGGRGKLLKLAKPFHYDMFYRAWMSFLQRIGIPYYAGEGIIWWKKDRACGFKLRVGNWDFRKVRLVCYQHRETNYSR